MQKQMGKAMRQKYEDAKDELPWYNQWWIAAQEEAADLPLTKSIEK